MSGEKLAVFFPGAGYGVDAPLLYYADFLLETQGYRHLYIDYGQPWEGQLTERITNASDVVFVSKSIGAVAAGKFGECSGAAVRQVFLTPVKEALPYIKPGCRVVIGTADKDYTAVHEWCEARGIACLCVAGADHSMELAGQVHESIDILHRVMEFISAADPDGGSN